MGGGTSQLDRDRLDEFDRPWRDLGSVRKRLDPRLDRLFYRLMSLEMALLRWGAPLPMGTSLFAVARRAS